MKKKELNFETSFKRLEEIVEELESGELSLEKSLKIFEEGVKLSRVCSNKLDEAEKKIEILLKNQDNELEAVPFDQKKKAPVRNKSLEVGNNNEEANDISLLEEEKEEEGGKLF